MDAIYFLHTIWHLIDAINGCRISFLAERRAGILKPQALTSDDGTASNKRRGRQNVAMQAILRRSQEQETKQVD